jgi:hypothetical protein
MPSVEIGNGRQHLDLHTGEVERGGALWSAVNTVDEDTNGTDHLATVRLSFGGVK